MSDWTATTVGALTHNHDSQRRPVKSSDRAAGIYPYYGASGIIDNVDGFTHDGEYLLIAEDGENLRSRSTPIGFMTRGRVWVNNHAHVVSGNDQGDTRFLNYLIAVTDVTGYITGSAQPKLSKMSLESIRVRVPDLPTQQAVAEVLGALDDKIAANQRLVATSDQLSALRFEALVASGSEVRPLSSLAQFVNGMAFTKGATGSGRVVLRIAELNSGIGNSTVYNDIDVDDRHLARPGDLLFAWSGSLTVHRWFRPEAIVNQHIFKVLPMTAPLWVVNGALRRKLADFKGIAADKATTMGHIQRHHLDQEVLVPTSLNISANDNAMTALWNRALQAERESLHLAHVRDTLLPLLMSGRLLVKDAEHVAAQVI